MNIPFIGPAGPTLPTGDLSSGPSIWTDEDLERQIEAVGRDRVFARARANGWSTQNTPPKWVWQQIVIEIQAEDRQRGRSNSYAPSGF